MGEGLNKLDTDTLITERFKNSAKYSGGQVSIGGGFGFGMGTPLVVGAQGSGNSTTQSAISGGTVVSSARDDKKRRLTASFSSIPERPFHDPRRQVSSQRECRTPGIMDALSLVLQVRTCGLLPLQE